MKAIARTDAQVVTCALSTLIALSKLVTNITTTYGEYNITACITTFGLKLDLYLKFFLFCTT